MGQRWESIGQEGIYGAGGALMTPSNLWGREGICGAEADLWGWVGGICGAGGNLWGRGGIYGAEADVWGRMESMGQGGDLWGRG